MTSLIKCRVCECNSIYLFSGNFRQYKVEYYQCMVCEYVQTQHPEWLPEAYASPINISDTGIMQRNRKNIHKVLSTLILLKRKHGLVLDYAGGFGFLVRMLRDIGIKAYWQDRYCDNLVARGFEYSNEIIDLVTAFEVFEHLEEPTKEFNKICSFSDSILLSTTLIPDPIPSLGNWDYYGLEHGQHIGFFRVKTLEYLAKQSGMHLLTDGKEYHLFTRKRFSRAFWLLLLKIGKYFPKILAIGLLSLTLVDSRYLAEKLIEGTNHK